MRISFTDRLTRRQTNEGTAFVVTAYFWDDSTETWTASTPTTIRYRIDSPSGQEIVAWTTGTPATSLSITCSATANAILNDCSQLERKILTVQCDAGLATQYADTYAWDVKNNRAYT
jgi:hypothetical protein